MMVNDQKRFYAKQLLSILAKPLSISAIKGYAKYIATNLPDKTSKLLHIRFHQITIR